MLSAEIDLAGNLARVTDAIAEVAVHAGRRPEGVTLVGISKTQPAELVVGAVRAGLRHVGENRVQEAASKFPRVKELLGSDSALTTQHSALAFHMVGHLQSNKAGAAIELFDRIDSVDSVKVAQALSSRLQEKTLPILIEVYVGEDTARPGVRPDQLIDVVGGILELPGLRVEGLMTVAPLGGDARKAFGQVRELRVSLAQAFREVHFDVLSMGMSEDFRDAIEEGSTEVRLGTALFGPRQQRTT